MLSVSAGAGHVRAAEALRVTAECEYPGRLFPLGFTTTIARVILTDERIRKTFHRDKKVDGIWHGQKMLFCSNYSNRDATETRRRILWNMDKQDTQDKKNCKL